MAYLKPEIRTAKESWAFALNHQNEVQPTIDDNYHAYPVDFNNQSQVITYDAKSTVHFAVEYKADGRVRTACKKNYKKYSSGINGMNFNGKEMCSTCYLAAVEKTGKGLFELDVEHKNAYRNHHHAVRAHDQKTKVLGVAQNEASRNTINLIVETLKAAGVEMIENGSYLTIKDPITGLFTKVRLEGSASIGYTQSTYDYQMAYNLGFKFK